MNIKKVISFVLITSLVCLVMLASFAACEKKEGGKEESAPPAISFMKEAATGDRNNYGGSVGYEFECLADMTVASVGRPLNGEMNNSHTIRIWQSSTETLLASAEVTPDSPLDTLGFKTADLDTTLTLKAGEKYRIVSSEENEGDKWYDVGVAEGDAPDLKPTDDAKITTPVFTGEGAWDTYPGNVHNPGGIKGYTGVTFYYHLVATDTADAEAEVEAE